LKLSLLYFLMPMIEALDIEERALTGSTGGHGERVAYLSCLMAKPLSLPQPELMDFVECALLHDCGAVENLRNLRDAKADGREYFEMLPDGRKISGDQVHALLGERIIRQLPFYGDVKDILLMHHECADGSGPLGLTEPEINFKSQIIFLVDRMDVWYDLPHLKKEEFRPMMERMHSRANHEFSERALELMDETIHWEDIERLQKERPDALLKEMLPEDEEEYSKEQIQELMQFFCYIVDNKSSFTKDHSAGIMHKASDMAQYYHWDENKLERFTLAAALHDYGKLAVRTAVLEKPGKLTDSEFAEMKLHVKWTYHMLNGIPGFEDIRDWASFHHEKLDGSGYCLGLTGKELTFEERLLGCIDIYQALTEKRPYKDGFSHQKTISIMKDMVGEGKIDGGVVEDLDRYYG
jgi:HD-GYP domain-containing protein (c-di-GMP phosphodiesterase class II)